MTDIKQKNYFNIYQNNTSKTPIRIYCISKRRGVLKLEFQNKFVLLERYYKQLITL